MYDGLELGNREQVRVHGGPATEHFLHLFHLVYLHLVLSVLLDVFLLIFVLSIFLNISPYFYSSSTSMCWWLCYSREAVFFDLLPALNSLRCCLQSQLHYEA